MKKKKMDENLFKLMKRIACSLPWVMGALSALTCSFVPPLGDLKTWKT
jgi:hypothetical protein